MYAVAFRRLPERLLQLVQCRQIQLPCGQRRRKDLEEILLLQGLQYLRSGRLVRDVFQFLAHGVGRNVIFQFCGARILELQPRPLLDRKAQADAEPHQAQQTRRIVVKRVGVESAQLLTFQVSQSVGGVEQQSARRLVQGKRDGVDTEITPAQIFLYG